MMGKALIHHWRIGIFCTKHNAYL